MLIDEVLPRYEVNEIHSIALPQAPEDAYAAIQAVTVREMWPVLVLMTLRTVPSLLARRPLPFLRPGGSALEEFRHLGFITLVEEPPREVVVGAIGRFWSLSGNAPLDTVRTREDFVSFDRPGFAKAALNFAVRYENSGSRVTTETRVAGTDVDAARLFRRYWLVIGPWSALIRRVSLRAIRRRAGREIAAEG